MAAEEVLGLGIIFFALIWILLGLLMMVFWIYTIIDCAKRRFTDSSERVLWILLIILTGVIGSAIYYFVVMRKH